jgi:hypothetical protein
MAVPKESLHKLSIEELDGELIARGDQTPGEVQFKFKDKNGTLERHAMMAQIKNLYKTASSPNPTLSHISTWELVETLIHKIKENNDIRGIWGKDNRMDFYAITDEKVKKNADSIAAICMKDNLLDKETGFSTLKHKNYGKTFNLCDQEPFHNQPISAGRLCTGFLVRDDVIATAGHCADEKNVTEVRIIFGFKMLGLSTPVTWIPNENIYKGVKIIHRVYDPKSKGADWEMIKLDRKVKNHPLVKLSEKAIYLNQPVYILGHPCGLPLKYASGAQVRDITEACFSADLNVYCGNSGSPVFDCKMHEVIGVVVRGDTQDFRWTGKGWLSIIYPNPVIRSQEPQCTRVSEFREIVAGAGEGAGGNAFLENKPMRRKKYK